MKQHTNTAFDNDLSHLDDMVVSLGRLAQSQLMSVIDLMGAIDGDMVRAVIAQDKQLDETEHNIFEKAVEIIALRAPRAADLRKVIIAPRIASSLERIGDMSKNISKRLLSISDENKAIPFQSDFQQISDYALKMLVNVNDAYSRDDVDAALAVWESDVHLDASHNQLMTKIVKAMEFQNQSVNTSQHCLFMAKNIERIGDHVTGIAEQICFRVNGVMLDEERPKLATVEMQATKSS